MQDNQVIRLCALYIKHSLILRLLPDLSRSHGGKLVVSAR